MKEEIVNYIIENYIDAVWEENDSIVFSIQEETYLYISDQYKNVLIYKDWTLGLSSEEEQILSLREDIKFVVFKWGGFFYYSTLLELKLIPFKYVGKAKQELDMPYSFLGIHGGYDLCNGSRLYRDWCKKANFLSIKSLGICEENTLGGLLSFQNACQSAGIKSILGITIKVQSTLNYPYYIKLFIANQIGYINLLRISNKMQVDNDGEFIEEDFVISSSKGLCCVLCNDIDINDRFVNIYKYKAKFKQVYYQLDLIQWNASKRDLDQLNRYKLYFQHYLNVIEPIFLPDSYFLDKGDDIARKILNSVGKIGFKPQSKQHYFKSLDQCFEIWTGLFKQPDLLFELFEVSIDNSNKLSAICNYSIPTGQAYLPQYILNEKEKLAYADSNELFWSLIEKGLEEKIIAKNKNVDIYLERIAEEMEVIELGKFIDYFLIVSDIVSWSASQNIWTGVGRGCFLPGNRVSMEYSSYKNIEDIVIGDKVIGRYRVEYVYDILTYDIDEEIVVLELYNGRYITCTKDHKILTVEGYVKAQDITTDHILSTTQRPRSYKQIRNKTFKKYKGKVYDLSITGDPSYNIEEILVHNSAAGCLISYLLGIVKVDPIEYKLLFTRFLNKGRILKTVKKEMLIINGEIELKETDILLVLRDGIEEELMGSELIEGDNIILINGKQT